MTWSLKNADVSRSPRICSTCGKLKKTSKMDTLAEMIDTIVRWILVRSQGKGPTLRVFCNF